MNSTLAERVTRGAEWLDQIKPGWAGLIDQDRLDMDSGHRCVLGQVFDSEAKRDEYWHGYSWASSLGFEIRDEVAEHGFNFTCAEFEDHAQDWVDHATGELTQLWLKAIETRKAGKS